MWPRQSSLRIPSYVNMDRRVIERLLARTVDCWLFKHAKGMIGWAYLWDGIKPPTSLCQPWTKNSFESEKNVGTILNSNPSLLGWHQPGQHSSRINITNYPLEKPSSWLGTPKNCNLQVQKMIFQTPFSWGSMWFFGLWLSPSRKRNAAEVAAEVTGAKSY